MFDFARIELGKLSPRLEAIEPGKVIAFYSSELESLAQSKGIKLAYRNRIAAPCMVPVDLKLFEIAFFNIASNALKFTPANGSIEIEARLEGDRLAVSIRDTGIGIDKELLPHIFDKLTWGYASEVERLYDGAGIGLSLSKKIVELHSGEIRAESEEGQGSKFTMLLPAVRADTAAAVAEAAISHRARSILSEALSTASGEASDPTPLESASAKGAELSLLLVEDNRELLEFMAERLADGFRVRAAGNGREALECLESGGASTDIVITDVMMPEMDGPRLYKEARRLLGEDCPPFIFLTARNDPEERREALADGVVDYLEKPFDLDELELRALGLVSMRRKARDGAKRDMRDALSRFLEEGGEKSAEAGRRSDYLGLLTSREAEIARSAAQGLQDKEIAATLGLSTRTVSNTLRRIYRKIGVDNRLELIRLLGE
jgi:DNA-binding NarL/FixJ family response regulator/anti-sigma regulatory factor (Ser/Thr protein kinase)